MWKCVRLFLIFLKTGDWSPEMPEMPEMENPENEGVNGSAGSAGSATEESGNTTSASDETAMQLQQIGQLLNYLCEPLESPLPPVVSVSI